MLNYKTDDLNYKEHRLQKDRKRYRKIHTRNLTLPESGDAKLLHSRADKYPKRRERKYRRRRKRARRRSAKPRNQTANITGQLSALALNQATNACGVNSNIADLKYTVATEACADRQAVTDALQVVTNTINAGVQSLKDQLNAQTLEAKNEEIANLRTQINLANLTASQNAQTAALIANNEAQTTALERYLAPVPVPAYIVANPNGCGCGYSYGSCGGYVA